MDEAPGRPILRWHGGKWRIAPWIISYFPEHTVYVEPFGGAGSVLMRKARVTTEIYNDLDSELVNLFKVLRNRKASAELERLLRLTPFSREEMESAFGDRAKSPIERARVMVIRSFMGHGADSCNRLKHPGFRGMRHVKEASHAYDWKNYFEAVEFMTERLQGVIIEKADAFKLIEDSDTKSTLFYLDPPYLPSVRQRRQRKVYAHELVHEDHARLADLCRGLKGMVILSGYRSGEYERLFGDWRSVDRNVVGEKATARTETIWLNPAAAKAQAQMSIEDLQ